MRRPHHQRRLRFNLPLVPSVVLRPALPLPLHCHRCRRCHDTCATPMREEPHCLTDTLVYIISSGRVKVQVLQMGWGHMFPICHCTSVKHLVKDSLYWDVGVWVGTVRVRGAQGRYRR
ncbi:hypothetical protein OF83DRAFT_1155972 [Amylostereum chailletii]|nr:hypothetical protein OF83DRAFT_1155972 [Amylostereum chailletii]